MNPGYGGSNGTESRPPSKLFEMPRLEGQKPGPLSLKQMPALAERGRLRLQHFLAWLEARLADDEFVCRPHFTIADISAMVAVDFAAWAKLRPAEHLGHLQKMAQPRFNAPGRQSLTSREVSALGRPIGR